MRSHAIHALLFVLILVAILFSPLTYYLLKDFMVSRAEKALGMDITFEKTHLIFPNKMSVVNLKAMDKDGPAFVAEVADFRLDIPKILKGKIALDCDFKNAVLKSGLKDSFNGVLKPLGVAVQDQYKFNSISGHITIGGGGYAIDGLNAASQHFRFSGNMARFKNKSVDYTIEFGINKEVFAPAEGRHYPLFIDEDNDGWYSVKLSMKGDPRRPSNINFSTGGIELRIQPSER